MQSLFKPFVALEAPVRYFFITFIAMFGGLHLADDIGYLYTSYKHTDPEKLFLLALFSSLVMFISRYLSQKKAKRENDLTITN
jgi:hypothetical protein